MRSWTGRTALVTGAAGGIGRALARELAATGARLALADRDAAGLAALAAELGVPTSQHVVDLAHPDAPAELVAAVLAAHGELSLLVCNAGLTVHGRFGELATAEIDRVLDVDLRGVLHLVAASLPALRARAPEAHIVLVSSMAGLQPFPLQSVYSAAKAGLRAWGAALRMELAAEGIGVTVILPGTIATGFLAGASSHDPALTARLGGWMVRFGTRPERVARVTARAIRWNRGAVRVGWDCHLVAALAFVAPPLLPAFLAWGVRRLPPAGPPA